MRFVIVSCVYPPEPMVSAQTSADLAKFLVAQSNDVSVITAFPSRPGGKLYPGYKRRLIQLEVSEDGYKIVRCFAFFSPESSMISRFLENISFGITSGLALLFTPKADVIYLNTWPLFATGILMAIARFRRIPFVLSIQDVYPESLLVQNRIDINSIWVKLLQKIDTWIAQQAKTVIVISERFAHIYRTSRQVLPEKIIVVPNWGNENEFSQRDPEHDIRRQYQIDSQDFVIAYGGNIGVAAGVETVIQAMAFLSSDLQVKLLIAGAGSQLAACQNLAQEVESQDIFFRTPWLKEETIDVLRSADVLILPTRGQQSSVSVPSKLITYMFAARPVIALANDNSETAEVVRQSQCGWVILPEQPEELATLITQVALLPKDELISRGEAGRQYALKNLSRSVNLPKVLNALIVKKES